MTRVKFSGMSIFSLVSNPQPSYSVPSVLPLRYEVFSAVASDIGYSKNFILISDIMSDSALFSPISDVPISGSVDIADHGYRTECPPMLKIPNFFLQAVYLS